MKLVVNMIMGSFMVSSAEGLELAKGVGLKEEDLIEVVNMAAIATPMFKLKVRCLLWPRLPHWPPAGRQHTCGAGWALPRMQCHKRDCFQHYAACIKCTVSLSASCVDAATCLSCHAMLCQEMEVCVAASVRAL